AVVRRHGKAWAAKTGGRVEVVEYDPAGDPPAADVWVIAPARLARWAAPGELLPVPESYRERKGEYDWPTLRPLYGARLLVWGDRAYAFPLLGESPLCFYREDLLKQEKKGPPATWEEFAEIAEHFQKKSGPSLPPLPAKDDDLDREFYAVAAPFVRRAVGEREENPPPDDQAFSFHYDLKADGRTVEPSLDARGFVDALKLLRRFQAAPPTGAAPAPPPALP